MKRSDAAVPEARKDRDVMAELCESIDKKKLRKRLIDYLLDNISFCEKKRDNTGVTIACKMRMLECGAKNASVIGALLHDVSSEDLEARVKKLEEVKFIEPTRKTSM